MNTQTFCLNISNVLLSLLQFQSDGSQKEVPGINQIYKDNSIYKTCPSVFDKFNTGSAACFPIMSSVLILLCLCYCIV